MVKGVGGLEGQVHPQEVHVRERRSMPHPTPPHPPQMTRLEGEEIWELRGEQLPSIVKLAGAEEEEGRWREEEKGKSGHFLFGQY